MVVELPTDAGWPFEPKWDGFLCLCCRSEDGIALISTAGKAQARYFPDIVESSERSKPAVLAAASGRKPIPFR